LLHNLYGVAQFSANFNSKIAIQFNHNNIKKVCTTNSSSKDYNKLFPQKITTNSSLKRLQQTIPSKDYNKLFPQKINKSLYL